MTSLFKNWLPYIELPKEMVITKRPYVTYLLLISIITAFVFQTILSETDSLLEPTTFSLWSLGGSEKNSVFYGQWFRLITAGFLHAGLFHLLLNSVALFACGIFLEKLIGHDWFFTIYFLSLLGGSVASLFINDAKIVSVGASGAIMGVIAANVVMSYRLTPGAERNKLQIELYRWLIPALLPLANETKIDYAGHIGGAIVGASIAYFLFKTWSKNLQLPRFIKFAKIISITGIFVILGAIHQSEKNRTLFSLLIDAKLLSEITSSKNILSENIEILQEKYPKDPRTWYYTAAGQSDFSIAERYLRRALNEKEILDSFYFSDGELKRELQITLGYILLKQKKENEAKNSIIPHCGYILSNPKNYPYLTEVSGLCK